MAFSCHASTKLTVKRPTTLQHGFQFLYFPGLFCRHPGAAQPSFFVEGKKGEPPAGQLHFLRRLEPAVHPVAVAFNGRRLFRGPRALHPGESAQEKTAARC